MELKLSGNLTGVRVNYIDLYDDVTEVCGGEDGDDLVAVADPAPAGATGAEVLAALGLAADTHVFDSRTAAV